MTTFRPCIDLHDGLVKQIVGSSLRDEGPGPQTNFIATDDAAVYARKYRADDLAGGHIIKLGPGNDDAALRALEAWPGGMQLGGGIELDNAERWLDAGASQVIVTSWLFVDAELSRPRVDQLAQRIGRERLVIDLSCRRVGGGWHVATDRWQTVTNTKVEASLLRELAESCCEFLVHAADVEGKCEGVDEELVARLGDWSPIPTTYAGGVRSFDDLRRVEQLSDGRVDLTIGSALDLFGGTGVRYEECVAWNRAGNSRSGS